MMPRIAEDTGSLAATLRRERTRLIGLCAYLTGDAQAAEDLAQETLLAAWQHADELRHPDAGAAWLSGIARHVCLGWARRHRRELVHRAQPDPAVDPTALLEEQSAEAVDVEGELERDELTLLLDRALALLPPETRMLLVESYIHEVPQAEIVARVGLNEGALRVRLHRGKLALRRVLTTELRQEATAYGMSDVHADVWQETRLWCPCCGRDHLMMRLAPPPNTIAFQCRQCSPVPQAEYRLTNAYFARLLGGITRPTSILKKTQHWSHSYFRRALDERTVTCTHCGRPAHLHVALPEDVSAALGGLPGVTVSCDACGHGVSSSLGGLVSSLPEVQRFWRQQARMRTLPLREVEVGGRAAVVTSWASLTSAARLDVVSACETYQVLSIHGAPTSARGC